MRILRKPSGPLKRRWGCVCLPSGTTMRRIQFICVSVCIAFLFYFHLSRLPVNNISQLPTDINIAFKAAPVVHYTKNEFCKPNTERFTNNRYVVLSCKISLALNDSCLFNLPLTVRTWRRVNYRSVVLFIGNIAIVKAQPRIAYVHPCEKVVGIFFQNQIWSRLVDINRLCLICIKISIEVVKMCQLSKRGYQQGPSDETLKKARYQSCDVKFGHRIIVTVG